MRASELRDLGRAELDDKLDELNEELFNLRFQDATGQLDNPRRLSEIRKDIARLKTVRRERELADSDGDEQP